MNPQDIFKFCPTCNSKLLKQEIRRIDCTKCGFKFYFNPSSCCSIILSNKKNQILFAKRGIQPFKNLWDLPGGFLNFNESFEEAAQRELYEELQVKLPIADFKYFSSGTDRYNYSGVNYYTTGVTFTALINSQRIIPKDDVSEIKWVNINKIKFNKIAFNSIKEVVKSYIKQKN